jgi:predicted Zn-dependent peptidase
VRNQLKNGLVTLVTPTPTRERAVVVVYLRTGSRFESPRENGLSHFLEHMLFRGTDEHPSAHRLAAAFEQWGGTLDATTAADHGTLGIDVPRENLAHVLPLLAEVFRGPLLKDIDIERGVIREEILEDLGESGEMIDPASLCRKLAFGSSGLGQPITGPLSNVERFSEAELRAHHQRTYIANDSVVSVAGPIDPDVISRRLEESFSTRTAATPLSISSTEEQCEARFCHVKHPGSSQTNVSLSFRCPSSTDELEPEVEMLLRVIDDGMATRLYHELCDKRGLCYSVSGSYETYADTGLVELEADTAHERAHLVLQQMLRVTNGLREGHVSDEEFERLMKRTRWQHEAYADEPGACADFFARAEMCATARTPHERLQQLLAVSREEIRAAAERIFRAENRNVVCVGSAKKKPLSDLALTSR